jgi:hypothetical protein
MAHANAVLLSFVSGVALVLGLAPGCSNSSNPTPQVAIVWLVDQGSNVGTCGAPNDTWTVGNTSTSPITTVTAGATSNGITVSATCSVAPNSTGYQVNAYAAYGTQGTLTISGQFVVASGASPGPQTNIDAQFSDHLALIANLEEKDCTVSFPKSGMGIGPGMVWGELDCPSEADQNGTVCDGTAEFLFEDCAQ